MDDGVSGVREVAGKTDTLEPVVETWGRVINEDVETTGGQVDDDDDDDDE